jgi:acetyltransferase-like isoleucine patch superfamily enzyme
MKNIFITYGFLGIINLIYFKIRTILTFKNAKLIRFPIKIRGKRFISIDKGFVTGFNCRIDAFSQGEKKILLSIGKNVQINDFVHIGAAESIIIGDNVLIASKVFISDHNHGNYQGLNQNSPETIPQERAIYSKPVRIEKNVWLGESVSVLPGVIIGEGSIIGANSVVNNDIPKHSIAVGSPARVVKIYSKKSGKWEKTY